MRAYFALFAVMAATLPATAQTACTGLCLQQVSCTAGATTSISGTVYAPNGKDPLPDVLVYIPNDTVAAFTPGVSCPTVGEPPTGAPLVGAVTAVDGTFKLTNVPVALPGVPIPLVMVTGRWRRQITVDTSAAACMNTVVPADSSRMPRNQSEGDIPKIAIATGSADQVECVLRKVGIDDAEFTDSNGSGRITLYPGSSSAGSQAPPTPGATLAAKNETGLMGDDATLNAYDMLMLPCEGTAGASKSAQAPNLLQFANAGGRVYASHFSYSWMDQVFASVAHWIGGTASNSVTPDPGIATVNTSFEAGNTLAQWLQLPAINAAAGPDEMQISTLKKDTTGIIAPTQAWLTLPASGNQVMQFVWNTPLAATNQCGRVLFNEYHVENLNTSTGTTFPNECGSSTTMSPQEKLLEYSLFELTSNGSPAALTPPSADFGSEPIGFTTAAQTFTWTNNATFGSSVTLLTAGGDFSVASSNCTAVAAGASCQIGVVFTPTALGARTGVLTVGSSGTTLTSTLTGNGTPGLTIATPGLNFGSIDVGGSATQTVTLTNNAPGGLALPAIATTGDYSATTTCASTIPALSSCAIQVTFSPTATGTRAGSLAVGSGAAAPATSLTGNGVDFSLAINPGSATVIGGYDVKTLVTTTPIAGFSSPVTLTCSTTASGSVCGVGVPLFTPSVAVNSPITITTTSKYTVIGYGGFGGGDWLWLAALGTGWLVWRRRKNFGRAFSGVMMLLLAATVFSITGCSGKIPAVNADFTVPGPNTYTLTATDGTITHSVTYTLNVTSK